MVMYRYYLKFHGAHTVFCRVFEGKMASAGDRTLTGRRLSFQSSEFNGDRPGTIRWPVGARPGIERCLNSTGFSRKSFYKSANAGPGTGGFPSVYRAMIFLVELPAVEMRHESLRSTYSKFIHMFFISFLETMTISTHLIIGLRSCGWLTCNEQVLLQLLHSLESEKAIGRNDMSG